MGGPKRHTRFEIFIDRFIPFDVLLLIFIVLMELFYSNIVDTYKFQFILLNIFVYSVFIMNLVFKYNHLRNFPRFLRRYWLDVMVVFPFFAFLRFFEVVGLVFKFDKIIIITQRLFHTGFELEKEVVLIEEEEKKHDKQVHRFFHRISTSWPRVIRVLKKVHHHSYHIENLKR